MWVSKARWMALESRVAILEAAAEESPSALIQAAVEANIESASLLNKLNALAARMAKTGKQVNQIYGSTVDDDNGAVDPRQLDLVEQTQHMDKAELRRIARERGLL